MVSTYERDPAFFSRMECKRFPIPKLKGEAMIRHVWDVEECRDLMSMRAWLLAGDLRQEELDTLWVSEPENAATASFGTNWGYYIGKDDIAAWYVDALKQRRADQKAAYEKAHPGVEVEPGIGCCNMFPTTTPLIRVSDDGKTARGIWYVIGQRTELKEDGVSADARWVCGRLFAEFIREVDGWKIWHLLDLNDMNYEAATDYNGTPTYILPEDDVMACEFGTPTVAMSVHENAFNWAESYPAMPEPYTTYKPETGYGPDGHPIYRKNRKEAAK